MQALRRPAVHGDGPDPGSVLETHISYVLLTGRHAYKVKKAITLGFLDYGSLEARRFYCHEELRLNRRLAPQIYLEVVAITGSVADPVIGGAGVAIEYAVKMREFAQEALLSRMLARGALMPEHIDALAACVAAFHGAVEVGDAGGPYGRPDEVRRLAMDNFLELDRLMEGESDQAALGTLRHWTEREYAARHGLIDARRQHGFVRECHGDLHLNNIALVDGRISVFDCIEFNDQIRWGDVMSEIAFATMDLEDRGRSDLASRFLTAYIERTGDYAGLGVLRFFMVYRAMVRAKVTGMRAAQIASSTEKSRAFDECRGYLDLARRLTQPPRPAILLMHGLAGSGKTTLSQQILESIGAVRLRTDVERKRLHGIDPEAHNPSALDAGLYAAAETERTYRHVCALVRHVTAAGYVAIVDAAFLRRWQRDLFREIASELGLPLLVVSLSEPLPTLRGRLAARSATGRDASDADMRVLEHQLRTQEPLASDEQPFVVALRRREPGGLAPSDAFWHELRGRLGMA